MKKTLVILIILVAVLIIGQQKGYIIIPDLNKTQNQTPVKKKVDVKAVTKKPIQLNNYEDTITSTIEKSLPSVVTIKVSKTTKTPSFEIFGEDYDTPDGTCIRDYIHVSDLALAHLLSLDYIVANQSSITINLGSENGYSVKEITTMAEQVVGRRIPHKIGARRPGDPAKLLASSAKARELLNWKPVFSDSKTLIESMWNVYPRG
jgi:UDP-glucose 4-epimerase